MLAWGWGGCWRRRGPRRRGWRGGWPRRRRWRGAVGRGVAVGVEVGCGVAVGVGVGAATTTNRAHHAAASTMRSAIVRKRPDAIEGASEGRSLVTNSRIPNAVRHPWGA